MYMQAIDRLDLGRSMLNYEGFADLLLLLAEKYFDEDADGQSRPLLGALRDLVGPALAHVSERQAAEAGNGMASKVEDAEDSPADQVPSPKGSAMEAVDGAPAPASPSMPPVVVTML